MALLTGNLLIFKKHKIIKTLQMNQTEIRKYNTNFETICSENINNISLSNQNSSITVIKANTYEANRDRTPKADISLKNNSSNKLIRVSSSKGINVISIRPSSTQKQVKQFNSCNNISIVSSSQTTIKQADTVQSLRQQFKKSLQLYEDKFNQQLSYQHNYLTVQTQKIKEHLFKNQNKLSQQKHELEQLFNRVQIVEKKVQAKTNLMMKQISQFKRFYQQCYQYTIRRVSEAENSMKSMVKYVQEVTSTLSSIQAWKYIQYVNGLVKNIVRNCSIQTSDLKFYVDQEIYELELGVGKFHEKYEELDKIVYQMKSTKFSNQSLKDTVKDLGKFGIVTNNLRKDQHKQNFLQYYEPKFKQIVKRVNNSTIQIDLIKGLVQNEIQTAEQSKKIQQISHKISLLEKQLQQQKSLYSKQLQQKQEIISRSNPRILQLETKLHANYEQEAKLLKQVSELKQKVAYYQTKCQKNSERQYGIQSSLAQAFAETLVKQKTKIYVEQRSTLQQKISSLQKKISQLDHQNFLLAQKLSKTQETRIQNTKLTTQHKFLTKQIEQLQQNQQKYSKQIQQCKKQNVTLLLSIEQLTNTNKRIQDRIKQIVRQSKEIKKDDDQYFCQLQEQVQKGYKEIQKLENVNQELMAKNKELIARNQTLEEDLHHYAQTFEKQSITFRTALQNLQKQKDLLCFENKKVSQQNRSLKLDLETTRTLQSFYENNSHVSLQLRKTVSSDLGCLKTPKRKLQKKAFSFKTGNDKVEELKNVLKKLKYDIPVVCQIDETGYLKDEKTGCYFFDENQNYFELGQQQLAEAVRNGLILL